MYTEKHWLNCVIPGGGRLNKYISMQSNALVLKVLTSDFEEQFTYVDIHRLEEEFISYPSLYR